MKPIGASGLALAIFTAACGGDGSESAADAGAADSAPSPDAPTNPGEWLPLITADWNLPAGDEGYTCATLTIPQDLYVGAIRPLAPAGTHHTVVDLRPPMGADDPGFACAPSFG